VVGYVGFVVFKPPPCPQGRRIKTSFEI
jgi:hypothetical protein